MLAGQRSLRGLLQWSRLGKRCSQVQCPRPPGAALRPFPRPASVIWCLVCLWWRSCDRGERRRGEGCGAPRTPTRVLAIDIDAGRSAPSPFREAPLTAHSACPALRVTSINTNNGVRGRGRGSGGWGRGQGEAVCVRVYIANTPIFSVLQVQHRSHSTKHVLQLWLEGGEAMEPSILGPLHMQARTHMSVRAHAGVPSMWRRAPGYLCARGGPAAAAGATAAAAACSPLLRLCGAVWPY